MCLKHIEKIIEIREDLHTDIEILEENLNLIKNIVLKLKGILDKNIVDNIYDSIDDSIYRLENIEQYCFDLHKNTDNIIKTVNKSEEIADLLEFVE